MEAPEERRGFMDSNSRLTERQYAAIGKVAALWSEAEMALERILQRLALAPSLLGYVLTDKLGPDNRISAIYSLITVHRVKYHGQIVETALLAEIEEYMPSVSGIKGDRNFVVHSVWSKASDLSLSRFDITATARSGLDISGGPCERLDAIEQFAGEVEKAAILLWNLGSRIPMIGPASLNKLHELEQRNRRQPGGPPMRVIQRKSYSRLRRVPPKAEQQSKKSKRA